MDADPNTAERILQEFVMEERVREAEEALQKLLAEIERQKLSKVTDAPNQTARWLSCDSAPRDGREILGYGSCSPDGDSPGAAVIFWRDGEWMAAAPWQPFYPTHWRQLPERPPS